MVKTLLNAYHAHGPFVVYFLDIHYYTVLIVLDVPTHLATSLYVFLVTLYWLCKSYHK
jgi:hypothetical protein